MTSGVFFLFCPEGLKENEENEEKRKREEKLGGQISTYVEKGEENEEHLSPLNKTKSFFNKVFIF